MQVLFLNEALMNAADAFGIELVHEEQLAEKLGYSEMSHAIITGFSIYHYAKLQKLGISLGDNEKERESGEEPFDFTSVLLDNGIIDPEGQITPRLNVIATKTDNLIFYIGDEDQTSSICELILNGLGQIKSMSEILGSQVWSHYCKNPE